MTNIAILRISEGVDITQRRIDDIISELGEAAAHHLIETALTQLALALRATILAAQTGDLARVTTQAERLSRLAWQVGLISLTSVAVDVGRCAEMHDPQALSATLARLQRVGNASLAQIKDAHLDGRV